MKLIFAVLFAFVVAFITPLPASQVGPGFGANNVVNSPASVFGAMTSTTNIGTICSLTKPEAGEWTVAITNNTTGTAGLGTIQIQYLAADNVTWYGLTTFNTPTGVISIAVPALVAATNQAIVWQFNGPILGLRVVSIGAGITAGSVLATISAN